MYYDVGREMFNEFVIVHEFTRNSYTTQSIRTIIKLW